MSIILTNWQVNKCSATKVEKQKKKHSQSTQTLTNFRGFLAKYQKRKLISERYKYLKQKKEKDGNGIRILIQVNPCMYSTKIHHKKKACILQKDKKIKRNKEKRRSQSMHVLCIRSIHNPWFSPSLFFFYNKIFFSNKILKL